MFKYILFSTLAALSLSTPAMGGTHTLVMNGAPTFGVLTTHWNHNYNVQLNLDSAGAQKLLSQLRSSPCNEKVVQAQGRDMANQLAEVYSAKNVTGVVIESIKLFSGRNAIFSGKTSCLVWRR
jgi:hypothetical protein